MVSAVAPFAIFVGVAATVIFAFYSFWGSVNVRATAKVRTFAFQLDRAGIRMSSQEIVLTMAGVLALVWISIVMVLHPGIVVSLILLPVVLGVGTVGFYFYMNFRIERRLNAFIEQLEVAMRLIAGGIRVGVGLRQALSMVIEELPDPAKYEFRRVIGQTNIGISIYDAMDDLADRMPCNESLMISRVLRVQSQTGGDLSKILDQLAATIKDRRQVNRKIGTLTAEGRMSAWVLMLIPVCLGLFIIATQPDMSHALLYTFIGHGVLIAITVMEVLAFFWLKSLLRVDF
jgi:Flp pilus assembly protein TadB